MLASKSKKFKKMYLCPDGQDVDAFAPPGLDVLHHGHRPASLYAQGISDIRSFENMTLILTL